MGMCGHDSHCVDRQSDLHPSKQAFQIEISINHNVNNQNIVKHRSRRCGMSIKVLRVICRINTSQIQRLHLLTCQVVTNSHQDILKCCVMLCWPVCVHPMQCLSCSFITMLLHCLIAFYNGTSVLTLLTFMSRSY